MSHNHLIKRDWEKDHVYLVQFPRCGCIPTPSPFALKLETWLRMMDIPYTNISNNFTKSSSKGQIPYIELNGRHVADSNICIEHIKKELGKDIDADLSIEEKSFAKAYHALIEDSLRWVTFYERSMDNKWLGTEKGFLAHFSGAKKFAFVHLFLGHFKGKLKQAVHLQGIGRHSQVEVALMAKNDLKALSVFLADKQYLFGDKPTTLDATAFGHLAQFIYCPMVMKDVLEYMKTDTPNILEYHERIKNLFWPDWDDCTNNLSLDTKWTNKTPKEITEDHPETPQTTTEETQQ